MKRLLTVSIIINIVFCLLIGYVIQKKGKISWLKLKISLEKRYDPEKPSWYWRNQRLWEERKTLYDVLPNDSSEIVFVGNSLIFGCEWSELFSNPRIKNRGIDGDNTEGVLARLTEITESKPKKIFLHMGTNDLALRMTIHEICNNYEDIIDSIKHSSPATKIYIQSLIPTNNQPSRSNDSIIILNEKLMHLANNKSATYINLFDSFLDSEGRLHMELSTDGIHLNGQGYLIWHGLIEKYVNKDL